MEKAKIKHEIVCGDVIPTLKALPDESVDMLMTSVPYFGLRSYGEDTTTIWGGDKDCEHDFSKEIKITRHKKGETNPGKEGWYKGKDAISEKAGQFCSKCGAWRGQLGLEPSPELYIEHLRMVFAEVKRVLKKTGTCWVNIGDSYASGKSRYNSTPHTLSGKERNEPMSWNKPDLYKQGYQDKCMCMIPERFAFMMLDLGYILRNKIIWHKCLSGNTPIYVRSMNKPLRTTVREAYRLPISTLELATGKGWEKVVRMEKQLTQDLLTVHLRNGMRIEVTPEHRFPTKEGLKEAKQLKKGDNLLHIQFSNEKGTPLGTRDIGWVIGLYLAEGSKKKKGVQFSLHAKESSFSKRLQEFAMSFAGEWKDYIYGNELSVVLSGSAVVGIIKNYVDGEGASKKHLSQRAFMENNDFLSGLLEGYLDGDGGYDEKNKRWRLGFTKNRDLEWDLRVICNRLGYHMRALLSKAKIGEREYPAIRGEIRKTTTGHFNQKDDYEILRIIKTKGITYEIEIDGQHLFALADGTLTHNSNPMPSSVKDRFNTVWEYVYFFTKNNKPVYYYNDKTGLMVDRKPTTQIEGVDWDWKEVGVVGANAFNVRVRDAELNRFLVKATEEEKGDYGKPKLKKVSHWHSVPYFFDLDAVREPYTKPLNRWGGDKLKANGKSNWDKGTGQETYRERNMRPNKTGKNPGDVFVISTRPFPEAHFAVFPEELCEKPILAGCPAEVCKHCGKARVRIMNRTGEINQQWGERKSKPWFDDKREMPQKVIKEGIYETIGWTGCQCEGEDKYEPGTIIDPFAGSGTVGVVAEKLGRSSILIDIKRDYCEMGYQGLLREVGQLRKGREPSKIERVGF